MKLANSGPVDLQGVRLRTEAVESSLLDRDRIRGLHITLDRCSRPWDRHPEGPFTRHTCPGDATKVLTYRPAIMSRTKLTGVGTLRVGEVAHLRVRLQLPYSAGDAFQGDSSKIRYTLTAIP